MRCSIGFFSSPRQYAPATRMQLEVAEPAGVGHVGAAAQVDEAGRVGVGAHQARLGGRHGIVGLALDDLELERVVAEQLERLGLGDLVAHERLALGDDLAHAGVEALEVVGREGLAPGQLEVVVEAVGDGRADGEGGAGELVEHGLGQHVGGRVAQREQPAIALLDDDGHVVAVGQDPVEVALDPVDAGDDRGLGQPRPDRRGQVGRGRAGGQAPIRTVGQRDGDLVGRAATPRA